MEGSVYSNLGLKKNRTFQEKRDNKLITLKDVLERKALISKPEELTRVFINEMKNILLTENVFVLIDNFFQLELDLASALEMYDFNLPKLNFEEFYRNLSPVLMRAILENANNAGNAEVLLTTIKESIRIALEEELHQIDDHF